MLQLTQVVSATVGFTKGGPVLGLGLISKVEMQRGILRMCGRHLGIPEVGSSCFCFYEWLLLRDSPMIPKQGTPILQGPDICGDPVLTMQMWAWLSLSNPRSKA